MQILLQNSSRAERAVRFGLPSEALGSAAEHPNSMLPNRSWVPYHQSLALEPSPSLYKRDLNLGVAVGRILAGVAAGLVAAEDRWKENVWL